MKHFKKYQYSSDKETKTFEIEIKLSTDFQLYFATSSLPEELKAYISGLRERIYGDSYSEINEVIRGLINDYENSFVEETREKIIAYFYDVDNRNTYENIDMNFGYRVCYRYKSGNNTSHQEVERGRYIEINSLFSCRDRSDHKEMLWSPEREAWFKEMLKAMSSLSDKIKEGLGGSSSVTVPAGPSRASIP